MPEADTGAGALTAELSEIDAALARLRREESERSNDLRDQSDSAALLTEYEEQDALIANLEARRLAIVSQLGSG